MAGLSEHDVDAIARRIAAYLRRDGSPERAGARPSTGAPGVFTTVDEAVRAAAAAQPVFVAQPLAVRSRVIATIRAAMLEHN